MTNNVEAVIQCPYHFPAIFGGCPPECPLKNKCPDYDGDYKPDENPN